MWVKREPKRYWLIYFEESGLPDELYEIEEAARARYENAVVGYNCHLFKLVSYNGKELPKA